MGPTRLSRTCVLPAGCLSGMWRMSGPYQKAPHLISNRLIPGSSPINKNLELMDRIDQAMALLDRGVDMGIVAQAVSLSVEDVKAGLALRGAPLPRSGNGTSSNASRPEECLDIMYEIAKFGRHEGTRFRAAKAVRDDLLGREDKVHGNSAEQDAFLARLTERAQELNAKRAEFFKKPIINV